MKQSKGKLVTTVLFLAVVSTAVAGVHYVDVNSASAMPPYTNWTTAATNIQDAVDAAVAGDQVVVTNGIYANGGLAVYGTLTNRVALNKPLTLRSVNGPLVTIIQGYQVPGSILGEGAIRCVYLTTGATLSGFTLTNGATLTGSTDFPPYRGSSGGGLWCESTRVVVSNCVLAGNSAYSSGGGAYGATLNNCTLSGNSSPGPYGGYGGGAGASTLNNCTLSGNSASSGGGGAYNSTLNNCALTGNSGSGGGAYNCTLNNCTLTGNSGSFGGGAYSSTLNNCTVTGNAGDGAYGGTLKNCALTGNSGVGARGCTLTNCTLTANLGGGGIDCALNNCVVYFNTAAQGANYDPSTTLNYCCTTPQPASGVGNIALDPQLASTWRLSAGSPCRGAGNASYASGTDLDGEAWGSPPSIGCDEYHAGALTGPLSVGVTASFTNVATGFTVQFTGLIEGRAAANSWDFGDGITATNEQYTSHAWASPGDYRVALWAYNESQPGGISASLLVHVLARPTYYVAADSGNPVAPYTSWATAASNLQDAVDAVTVPGAQVVVTNGMYAPIQYRTDGLTVRSMNGPQFTVISGGHSNACATLTGGASLSGFTLTNGFSSYGGGASGGTLSNCVLTGNLASAPNFSGYGGGAAGCTLNNCTLSSNSASGLYGGGAYYCTLNHCVLSGNSGYIGGGATYSTLNDCTLTGNSASAGGGGAEESTLNNCTLTGNSSSGAYRSTLNNCTLTGNSGNGAEESTVNNCALTANFGDGANHCIVRNSALSGNSGVGARYCLMTNCTVTGNSGGGAAGCGWYPGCTLNNCILYFNNGPNYDSSSTLYNCCTTPEPANGVGNISSDPQLASSSHLSASSPCRRAGSALYATGTDIDGEPWLNPPSIGCDEYSAGALSGPLSVGIAASFTNVLVGFTLQLTALIEGRTTGSVWDFGDGITLTNQPYTAHAWSALGDYAVVLRAYNESQAAGISATVIVHVVNGIHYVAADGANPEAPYASWATAATNIQDAINALEPGGPVAVVVSNGNYAPVVASRPVTVRSVNGPLFTTINGGRSNLCLSLALGASLSGFTLTDGTGGVSGGTLSNCTLVGNTSYGASSSTLNNCTITGNSGVGASGCTLNNCAVAGNSGVGASSSSLTNCTLTGNSGGGASGCALNNCIVYFNTAAQAANYDYFSTLNYCCATPQPTNGVGNISSDPQLVSSSHLSAGSPCRGAGNAGYATGIDIDGEGWLSPPSIGCDEYHAGAVTGPLSVSISASFTNALLGFTVQFTALIGGRTTSNFWDFGDGAAVTNQPYTSHVWTASGDYAVVLRVYNETHPGGVSATSIIHVGNGVHYVAANSANPVGPYASWATAATNIQDAISVVEAGGPLAVVVTNGNYASVAASGPVTVNSVNGPLFTIINGGQSNVCVSLTNGASLSGFTLTNGLGGAFGGTLSNCKLTGNTWYGASYSSLSNCTLTGNPSYGATYSTLNNCTVSANTYGGAYSCTLNGCAVAGNSGVGASSSSLTNCTLIGNSGGGASGCSLNNCIAYFNTGAQGANYDYSSTLNYCCATPQPTNGVGNISSDPQLVSSSHLSADSPCRGTGNEAYARGTDIDGEPWLSPPSIGCDEYHAGSLTGPLTVEIVAPYTNVVVGYPLRFMGLTEGRAAATSWDFGDGSTATNQPLTTHAWTTVGDYAVVLRAFNRSQPAGISVTITVHVVNGLHYVAAGNTNPVAPYTSWATAATSIQDAINAAEPGAAQVLVTNGIYGPIYVPTLMTVRGINGPQFTRIDGGGGTRCANLATNAVLSGFTLSNGFATESGGGAYGGTLTNCILTGNVAEAPVIYSYRCVSYDPRYHFCRLIAGGYSVGDAYGGGAAYCTLNNCTLAGNVVESPLLYNPNGNGYEQVYSSYSLGSAYGGGAAFCTLNNCTLTDNLAQDEPLRDSYYDFFDPGSGYGREVDGGGAYQCTLANCLLSNNWVQGFSGYVGYDPYDPRENHYVYVPGYGGGARDCTLTNCTVAGNSGSNGGSVVGSSLSNCLLSGNSGDGASSSTLNNCAITGNSGFGASSCWLTNCTLTGNSGQGASSSTLNNCIAYFNSGKNYDSSCTLNYCCTTPMPTNGVGNISLDPQLATASHLSAASPCRGAGHAAYASGTDIDGEPWGNPPSIGCDEYTAGALKGPLSVGITASYTNVAVGFAVNLTGFIEGRTESSSWDFADGSSAANEPYISHAWSTPGDYAVVLGAFNQSYPGGVSATLTVHVVTEIHYVAGSSVSPAAPYTSWATAATNLQDALGAAVLPGALVLVTNGTYASIQVTGAVNLRSVNGPLVTLINGNQSNLCVSLGVSATLSGFSLTNGAGGVSGGTLNNCILTGNSAAYYGGGAAGATLNNCLFTGNSATNAGGGAYSCTLNNCTLTGNSALNSGGGAYGCALNDCIIYFNTALQCPNYDPSSTLNYCCTTPQPTIGVANISSPPQLASASHLSAGSPCRGAGNADYTTGTDMDGEAWASPPSIGCDEYHAGAVIGPMSVAISAQSTNVATGFPLQLTALIEGRISGSVWEFGDGFVEINEPYTSYSWDSPGDYLVALWCFNDTHPEGVRATVTIHVSTGIHYVVANSLSPAAPYTSWATAATNIQDAIDAATEPGAQVLVTNGIYATGLRMVSGTTNRLVIHPYLTLQSVNGPESTIVDGGYALRCVYLAGSSAISGFTLMNGAVSGYAYGGGVFCESSSSVVSNCVLAGNSASYGGGAYSGMLNNCTLSRNVSPGGNGGGAYGCALNNCTLTGNSSVNSSGGYGGGAHSCNLTNCTLTANSSSSGGGAYNCTLSRCVLGNNSAYNGAGAYSCMLYDCTLTGNSGPAPYTQGGGAYSCALSNCTLTGNSAISGGGAYSSTLNNCTLSDNSAPYYVTCVNSDCFYLGNGAGAYSCMLTNCTLVRNFAGGGGGAAYLCNLTSCTLTGNSAAYYGGGAASSTLNNCTLSGNSTSPTIYGGGGGASSCTLNNCTLTGNSTRGAGGGASNCTLNNCGLNGNWATGTSGSGGGAFSSRLNNCSLTGNWAALSGGGVCSSFLNNCTLTENSALYHPSVGLVADSGGGGGGACSSTLNNCILYYNTGSSGPNYDGSSALNYCCTTPLPASGTNNTEAEPLLASASHLSASSPCIGRGNAAFATGADIDGEPWANPPSIGCDEYHTGSVMGPLSVAISVPFTNITRGFTLGFTSLIEGRTTASVWEFSDGITVSNQPYTSRAWTSVGDYAVVLRAYNESLPGGISATVTVHIVTAPPISYVAADSTNPVAPYTSWATAAINIQDAVDAATVPGGLVLVTNGTYASGGRAPDGYTTNRVTLDKPLSLRSVNGPQFTTIDGAHWNRCAYLTNGASLAGFTLTNGWDGGLDGGGGVKGGTVTNCVLVGNLAGYGGAARDSVLNDCTLTGNSANYYGGGAYGCTLAHCSLAGNNSSSYNGGGAYDCTLSECSLSTNSAGAGGGAHSSTLRNCTLTGNWSYSSGGGVYSCMLSNCTLTGNSSYGGGGAASCTLDNCSLKGNTSSNGGGANSCTLNNCLLTANSADYSGGGAEASTLNHCTLTGNSSTGTYGGGGVYYCTLNNCIAAFNSATNGPNFDAYSILNYCCTTPRPAYGVGNITNAPLFVNTNAWADLRLQPNSSCINAGNNAYVTNATDLDGNPRIAGGTVDIGAYEFQSPASMISYAWLQQYGLPIDSSTDTADPDRDGVNNYHEWLAGTDPTNPVSSPAQLAIVSSATNVVLMWSINAVAFKLQSTTNGDSPRFWIKNPAAPLVIGGQNVVTNPITGPQQFYRLSL